MAISKLLAADGIASEAIATARDAAAASPASTMGLEQLASLFADSGDTVQLDTTVRQLRQTAPDAGRHRILRRRCSVSPRRRRRGRRERANAPSRSIRNYTPTYDLIGAALHQARSTRSGARRPFRKSLSFDAHDSTAYENLGVLELNAGNRAAGGAIFCGSVVAGAGFAVVARGTQTRAYGISLNIGRPAIVMMLTSPSRSWNSLLSRSITIVFG